MNTKQERTLRAIFEIPTRSDIRYSDLMSLFKALGGKVQERSGSRVAVKLGERKFSIHRPHPGQIIGKKTVEDIRSRLIGLGIEVD